MLAMCVVVAGCAAAGPSGVPAAASPAPSAPGPASAAATAGPTPAGPATPAQPVAATTVVIANFLFAPADLTVAPGATVTVVNRDGANHTLTAKDHSFDTGNIPGNATGTFTAPTKPGTYPYVCAIHPFMTATLTVS